MQDFAKIIQDAIERDGRSIYAISRDSKVHVAAVQRFASGERLGITIQTAAKLCDTLGLELRPKQGKGR